MAYSGCDNLENWEKIPDTKLCKLNIIGPIAYLKICRNDVYNALNIQLISELIEILSWTKMYSVGVKEKISDSDGIEYLRVLVFTSEGKHFCAGADINMMRDAGTQSLDDNRKDSIRLDDLFNSLWAHPCFTIGCIQGVALGGGAGLVACMDHVVATLDSKIALSEAKLGILPAVIGPYVYRKIGSSQFRRLSILANKIDVNEALRIGYVNEIVDSIDLFKISIDNLIKEILTTAPIAAYEAKKLTLTFDRWYGSDEELRKWTLDKTTKMRGSIEGQEGLSSFLERRSPNWFRDIKEN